MDKIQFQITSSKLLGSEFSKIISPTGELIFVRNSSLKTGDIILCHTDNVVPVKAEVLSIECRANLEFMTGELKEYKYVQGDTLASGALVTSECVKLRCLEDACSSFIEKIKKELRDAFFSKKYVS